MDNKLKLEVATEVFDLLCTQKFADWHATDFEAFIEGDEDHPSKIELIHWLYDHLHFQED